AESCRPGVVVERAGRAAKHPDHLADLAAVEEHFGSGVAVVVGRGYGQPAVPIAHGGRGDRDGFVAVGGAAGGGGGCRGGRGVGLVRVPGPKVRAGWGTTRRWRGRWVGGIDWIARAIGTPPVSCRELRRLYVSVCILSHPALLVNTFLT